MDIKAPVIKQTEKDFAVKNVEQRAMPEHRLSNEAIIVHCAETVETASVTLSLIFAAKCGKQWAAIKFNRPLIPEVFCLLAAPSIEVQRAMAGDRPTNDDSWYQSICPDGISEMSLFDALGFAQFKQKAIQKLLTSKPLPELLLVEARVPHAEPQVTQFALTRLRDELRKIKTSVILVLQGGDPARLVNAMPRSDVLFVAPCVPDPDAILAYKVHSKPLSALWLADPDPAMISLLRAPSLQRWRQETYLASDPTSRALLRMRQAGKSLEQIGEALDMDKSTVKRRLDKLKFDK